jgi:Zn-finger nucleic acid-binding protein
MGQMRQYERSGITVDQCTECRGIFLDRGELERLLDAENSWHGGSRGPQQQQHPQQQHAQRHKDWDSDEYPVYRQEHGYGGQHPHKKKKRGFLEELFD